MISQRRIGATNVSSSKAHRFGNIPAIRQANGSVGYEAVETPVHECYVLRFCSEFNPFLRA
jgi:hypothetical protein